MTATLASGLRMPDMIAVLNEQDFHGSLLKKSKAKKCKRNNVEPIHQDRDHALLDSVTFHRTGTPEHSIVYKKYPDPLKRLYIPLGQYDEVVVEAKRAEFISIARKLCAKSISVSKDDSQSAKSAVNAGANAVGAGEGGGSHSNAQSNKKTQSMDQEFDRPEELLPAFDDHGMWFYQWEPSWKTMVEGRTEQGSHTLSYKCDFTHQSASAKSAKLTAGMQGIGLDLGGSKETQMSVNEVCVVEFWRE